MLRYTAARVALTLPMLFALSVAVFFYVHAVPGDPIAGMLGPAGTPEMIERIRAERGLDVALWTQYWQWLTGLPQGDLGVSLISGQAITPQLINRIPATLQLTAASLFVTLLIGLPAGFLAGLRQGSWLDRVLTPGALVGLSMPVFWLGTVMILVLGVRYSWFPTSGYTPFTTDPMDSLRFTVLPAVTLGLHLSPFLARLTRAVTLELQQEQFIKQARAKGLRSSTVIIRYSMRNAILPVLTVLGLLLGTLLGGQVIVEQLFNWPGIGRLLVQGAIQRDYLMVQSLVLVIATLYVVINLGVELLHGWMDPRIRLR